MTLRVHIVTLFPEFFATPATVGVLGRAVAAGLLDVHCVDPRDFTHDRHRTVDDTPYGGGAGMVLKAPPVIAAIESVTAPANPRRLPVVLLSPQGEQFDQARARDMAGWGEFVLLCGRYKAVDERVRTLAVTHEVSVGDFVLSGGEPAALLVLDAVSRLVPGVLGNEDSADTDSFGADGKGGLDCGYYTRPAEYRGHGVPDVLLSGDHARIEEWRRQDAARRTRERRPDLNATPEHGAASSLATGRSPK